MLSGRTRQNKLVHFTPPQPLRAGAYATVEITRAAPTISSVGSSSWSPSPRTSGASPCSPGDHWPTARHPRADGVGQERCRDGPRPAARSTSRSSPSTRCRSIGGWTSARPSRPRPIALPCRTTASTSSSRATTSPSPSSLRRPAQALAEIDRATDRAVLVAGTGLYLRASPTRWSSPGAGPRSAPSSRHAPRHEGVAAPARELAALDPVGCRADGADQRAPRRACARGHARQRPSVQLVRSRSRHAIPPVPFVQIGLRWPRPLLDRRESPSGCIG